MRTHLRPRTVFPFLVAVGVGLFLSVASHELEWSESTTLVVGIALIGVLALFGTPLMLLPFAEAESDVRSKDRTTDRQVEGRRELNWIKPRYAKGEVHEVFVTGSSRRPVSVTWREAHNQVDANLVIFKRAHPQAWSIDNLRGVIEDEDVTLGRWHDFREAQNPTLSEELDRFVVLGSMASKVFASNDPELAEHSPLARAAGE